MIVDDRLERKARRGAPFRLPVDHCSSLTEPYEPEVTFMLFALRLDDLLLAFWYKARLALKTDFPSASTHCPFSYPYTAPG